MALKGSSFFFVNEQCEVEIHIGSYKDKIMFDIIPNDVYHILLGRSWQFDRGVVHDGKKKIYKFGKDGINHTLSPVGY